MKRLCLALILFAASPALAHHFKGLPHFNYFENYPQVPQEEYLWQEKDYEYSLVLYDFQGIQKQDAEQPENVRLYLVIYSLIDRGVYNGPLTVEIRDRGEVMYERYFPESQEESIYAFEELLPETGKYSLGVRIGPHSDILTAEIPFKLSSQKVPWGRWVTICLGGIIVVVAVGSRRARVIRDRKQLADKAKPVKPGSPS